MRIRRCFVLVALLVGCGHAADPGTEVATYTIEQLTDPETCRGCHASQYRDWSGSMHAYASDDPLFVALNAKAQAAGAGVLCAKCHAPMGIHQDKTDGSTDSIAALPKALRGVTCYFCHDVDAVLGTHNNPIHLADDTVMRGEYADPVANKAHRSGYSTYLDRDRTESALMCGSCHDIVNQKGAHVERTYEEWQETVFSTPLVGTTCGQCHMPQSRAQEPIAQGPDVSGVFARRTHSHAFPGVDIALTEWPEAEAQRQAVQDFLDSELQTALCVRGIPGAAPNLMVIVDNISAGHKWPSGAAQDRRLWVEINAYKDGQAIYQSGAVPEGTGPAELTGDPDFWLMRDCLFDADGQGTHDFWNAATYESNSLPGQLTFDPTDKNFYRSHVYQYYPRTPTQTLSAYPDRVTMRVELEAFPRDFFEDTFARPADLGLTDDQVAAMRAKLPRFTVGKEVEWTPAAVADTSRGGQTYYEMKIIPVNCVTNTAMVASADKVEATNHTMCTP